MKDRADTPEKKRVVIERLCAAWLAHPELRLGQLIENARSEDTIYWRRRSDLFYVEDMILADAVEALSGVLTSDHDVSQEEVPPDQGRR